MVAIQVKLKKKNKKPQQGKCVSYTFNDEKPNCSQVVHPEHTAGAGAFPPPHILPGQQRQAKCVSEMVPSARRLTLQF